MECLSGLLDEIIFFTYFIFLFSIGSEDMGGSGLNDSLDKQDTAAKLSYGKGNFSYAEHFSFDHQSLQFRVCHYVNMIILH